jgi:hypothetical protein
MLCSNTNDSKYDSDDSDSNDFFDDDSSILSDEQLFAKISKISGDDVGAAMEVALRKSRKV